MRTAARAQLGRRRRHVDVGDAAYRHRHHRGRPLCHSRTAQPPQRRHPSSQWYAAVIAGRPALNALPALPPALTPTSLQTQRARGGGHPPVPAGGGRYRRSRLTRDGGHVFLSFPSQQDALTVDCLNELLAGVRTAMRRGPSGAGVRPPPLGPVSVRTWVGMGSRSGPGLANARHVCARVGRMSARRSSTCASCCSRPPSRP